MLGDVQAARLAKAGLSPHAEIQNEAARLMQAVNADFGSVNSGAVESGVAGNKLPDLLVETSQAVLAQDSTQQTDVNTVQSPQHGVSNHLEGLAGLDEVEGSQGQAGSERLEGSEGLVEPNSDTAHPQAPQAAVEPDAAVPEAHVAERTDSPAEDVRDESAAQAIESTQARVGS
jgi:hypothetical protein